MELNRPRLRQHTVPPHTHPLVRLLFQELRTRQIPMHDLCSRSGLSINTVINWRAANTPNLINIEAALNAIGYDLVAIPKVHHDTAN
jgi:hypothetical protein